MPWPYYLHPPPAAAGHDRAAVVRSRSCKFSRPRRRSSGERRSKNTCETNFSTRSARPSLIARSIEVTAMHELVSPSLSTIIADTTIRLCGMCCIAITKRAAIALKRAGTHRYAADPSTEVLCCAFAVDDEPVQLWIPGDPVPPEFIEAAAIRDWIVSRTRRSLRNGDRAAHHGAALRLAGDPARAPPLHDECGAGAWLAGAAEHGRRLRSSSPTARMPPASG